ncbi:MAG: BatD family protein [Anaerolineae bacterium]
MVSHNFLRNPAILAVTLLLALLWVAPARAQNPITARVDADTVAADGQLTLTVTVTGDFLTIPRPDISAIQDFIVVSSGQSTQVSIVNGKMTSQGVFIYRLQPLAEGDVIIPPVTVNIDGAEYSSDPIPVQVLPAGSLAQPDRPDADTPGPAPGLLEPEQEFFVEAAVDNPNPYLGEQIIYTFRLYQSSQIFGQPDYRPPAFTDFWSSEIVEQPRYNTTVDGRQYAVSEIRTALFPANLGQLTIAPARLIIPGGLFKPDVKLETEPLTVNVKPLPENKPDDFNGAVGRFEIRASLSDSSSKVNEPLTLLIEIEGTGNIETLIEPELPDMPNWRFFESQASTSLRTDQGQLGGIRSFERLVVPGQAGEQTFPPISFSFYNPQSETFETVTTQPIPVDVLPDDSVQPLPIMPASPGDADSPELLNSDIVTIKPVPFVLDTPAVLSAAGRVLFWSLWVIPLFVMGGALVWKNKQVRLENDPAYARSVRAQKTAQKILDDAQHPGADACGAAGRALLGFLSDKLNTPTAGLTTDGLVALLRQHRLDDALVTRVRDVLLQVDVGRYAPIAEGDAQTLLEETRQLITALEKEFAR